MSISPSGDHPKPNAKPKLSDDLQAQLAYLREQDAKRVQKLYYSDEHKVFFVTKQPRHPVPDRDGREAYISVKPYNELAPDVVMRMKTVAEAWEEKQSQVRIAAWERDLVFVDVSSRTESFISISRLDADVRKKLQPSGDDGALWKKYAAAVKGETGHALVAPAKAEFRKRQPSVT